MRKLSRNLTEMECTGRFVSGATGLAKLDQATPLATAMANQLSNIIDNRASREIHAAELANKLFS
jgi:hypothetical protein